MSLLLEAFPLQGTEEVLEVCQRILDVLSNPLSGEEGPVPEVHGLWVGVQQLGSKGQRLVSYL